MVTAYYYLKEIGIYKIYCKKVNSIQKHINSVLGFILLKTKNVKLITVIMYLKP